MKANELRIGNYVDYYGNIVTINSVNENDVGFSDYVPIDYPLLTEIEPIPLTEDWLVRFGFEKINTTWYAYKRGVFRLNISFDVEWVNNWMGIRLKHVHQFQNIYFALTGQELEIISPTPYQ